MAVPFGLSTTLYITLINGQGVTVIWGWVFITLVSLCIAASMAEICAVYPVAGGPYFWSAMLSPPQFAPIAAWVTGWLNLVGNWLVMVSINFSGSQIVLSAATLFHEDYVPTAWQTVVVFWAFISFSTVINIFGTRYLNIINTACIAWTSASIVIFMVVLLATCGKMRSGAFVFANYDTSASGWPTGWSFFIGLLQGAYVMLGYGLISALCEEARNPAKEVPRAIVTSVLVAGVLGAAFLIPVMFTLPEIEVLLAVASGQPIGLLFKLVTGSSAGAMGLLILIIGIFCFSSIGSATVASRFTYAFSRDGAVPGHKIWSRVSQRLGVPVQATLLGAAVSFCMGPIYFGSSAAFNSFTGTATICLSTSYGVPIFISLLRRRRDVENSLYSLKPVGTIINAISVTWVIFSTALFCMPVALPATASTMNYASVVFTGFGIISIIWYIVYGRKHFSGPMAAVDKSIEGQIVEVMEREVPAHAKKHEA